MIKTPTPYLSISDKSRAWGVVLMTFSMILAGFFASSPAAFYFCLIMAVLTAVFSFLTRDKGYLFVTAAFLLGGLSLATSPTLPAHAVTPGPALVAQH